MPAEVSALLDLSHSQHFREAGIIAPRHDMIIRIRNAINPSLHFTIVMIETVQYATYFVYAFIQQGITQRRCLKGQCSLRLTFAGDNQAKNVKNVWH